MSIKIKGSASFSINDISMTWDDRQKRVEKPCVKCGKKTRGRFKGIGGLAQAGHLPCAMAMTTDKALRVYAAT